VEKKHTPNIKVRVDGRCICNNNLRKSSSPFPSKVGANQFSYFAYNDFFSLFWNFSLGLVGFLLDFCLDLRVNVCYGLFCVCGQLGFGGKGVWFMGWPKAENSEFAQMRWCLCGWIILLFFVSTKLILLWRILINSGNFTLSCFIFFCSFLVYVFGKSLVLMCFSWASCTLWDDMIGLLIFMITHIKVVVAVKNVWWWSWFLCIVIGLFLYGFVQDGLKMKDIFILIAFAFWDAFLDVYSMSLFSYVYVPICFLSENVLFVLQVLLQYWRGIGTAISVL